MVLIFSYVSLLNKRDILFGSSEIVDWSKLKNKRISIRNWKRGDAFRPLGLTKYQKLSDFFINNKINQFKKRDNTINDCK